MNARSVCASCDSRALAAPVQRNARVIEPLGATASLAARIAGVLTVTVLAVGLAVHLESADWARRLLAFRFPGVPAEPAVASASFLHNLHALLAIGGALLVAQAPYLANRTAQPGSIHRTLQGACEAVLAGGVAANVIVIGASFGAYGPRMIRAALPHGPVELAAYSVAIALYIQGRRQPLAACHVLAIAAVSTSALGAAAVLETYVNL
jgi:hypothetical protein